jgi:hypothetical protein
MGVWRTMIPLLLVLCGDLCEVFYVVYGYGHGHGSWVRLLFSLWMKKLSARGVHILMA